MEKAKQKVIIFLTVILVFLLTLTTLFVNNPAFAKAETVGPTTEQRENIKGLDVEFNGSISPEKAGIYAKTLSKSWNEENENEIVIFEYVIEGGNDGAGRMGVFWGDGILPGYGDMFSQKGMTGYNACFGGKDFTVDNKCILTKSENNGKRVFIVMSRKATGTYDIYVLDKNEEPVWSNNATAWNRFGLTNITRDGGGFAWSGIINGVANNTAYTKIPNMITCGFQIDGSSVSISGLKCYNSNGEDLGIEFTGFDYKVTNLDTHANDEYLTTGSASDTNLVAPVNYNYHHPSATTQVIDSFNYAGGHVLSGFYSKGDSTFNKNDFGIGDIKTKTLTPTGSVIVFGRDNPLQHKYAMEFGKTINVNDTTLDSISIRFYGNKMTYTNQFNSNSVILFGLQDEECKLDTNKICLNNYISKTITTEHLMSDFVEVEIKKSDLVSLADEDGNIKGFQVVMVNGDTYAYFMLDYIKVNKMYSITYELDGGSGENVSTWGLTSGEVTLNEVTKDYYDFSGFYTSNAFNESDKITVLSSETVKNDLTLYAKFVKKQYTISFNSNADVTINSITKVWGETVDAPTPPTVENMDFIKWVVGDNDYTFTEMPKENITVNALYEGKEFDISSANVEHGTISVDEKGRYGNQVSFTLTIDTGYELDELKVFNGTQSVSVLNNGGTYTFTMPSNEVSISYALKCKSYFIYYEKVEGAVNENRLYYTIEDTVTLLEPTKTGYTFDGWYLDENYTNKITVIDGMSEDLTLYAKFTEIKQSNSSNNGLIIGLACGTGAVVVAVIVVLLIVKKSKIKKQ